MMTIDDVKQILYDKYHASITSIDIISRSNGSTFCDLPDMAYSYDDMVERDFVGEQERPKSFDAISICGIYVNFIEFKSGKINKKTRDDIRLKLAEGLHYFERCILHESFINNNRIKLRFVLVYSKKANAESVLEKQRRYQRQLNESILSLGHVQEYQPFIGSKYTEKLHYVDEANSLNEEEFIASKSKYIGNITRCPMSPTSIGGGKLC